MNYEYVITQGVTEFLFNRKSADRVFLIEVFGRIADNPGARPDFIIRSAANRDFHVRAFDKWQITYWVDHWAREVRIQHIGAAE